MESDDALSGIETLARFDAVRFVPPSERMEPVFASGGGRLARAVVKRRQNERCGLAPSCSCLVGKWPANLIRTCWRFDGRGFVELNPAPWTTPPGGSNSLLY